jgi:hypothetical protein
VPPAAARMVRRAAGRLRALARAGRRRSASCVFGDRFVQRGDVCGVMARVAAVRSRRSRARGDDFVWKIGKVMVHLFGQTRGGQGYVREARRLCAGVRAMRRRTDATEGQLGGGACCEDRLARATLLPSLRRERGECEQERGATIAHSDSVGMPLHQVRRRRPRSRERRGVRQRDVGRRHGSTGPAAGSWWWPHPTGRSTRPNPSRSCLRRSSINVMRWRCPRPPACWST